MASLSQEDSDAAVNELRNAGRTILETCDAYLARRCELGEFLDSYQAAATAINDGQTTVLDLANYNLDTTKEAT